MIHIVLLGDTYVGKSTLFDILIHNNVYEGFCTTITPKYGIYNDKYILYDLPGAERWRTFAYHYLKIADAAIVLYDVQQGDNTIEDWKQMLIEINRKDIPILTVANKIDLCTYEENPNILYISCKKDNNIHEKLEGFFSTLQPNPKISIGWLEYVYLLLPSVEDLTDRMVELLKW